MSTRAFDDREMTGYLLPEDGQRLLKELSGHIRVLARLAQPRMADETEAEAPKVDAAELTVRLDQLAEQLEQVLKGVSSMKRPGPPNGSRGTAAAADEDLDNADDAETDDADDLSNEAYAAQASDQRLVFGVTMDQFDKLSLLVQGIKAYGDAVSAEGRADFAEGTLTMLGHTIFDRAVEVDEILGEIDMQTLEPGARSRFAVEEPRAAYGVEAPREVGQVPWTGAAAASASASASVIYGPLLVGASVH